MKKKFSRTNERGKFGAGSISRRWTFSFQSIRRGVPLLLVIIGVSRAILRAEQSNDPKSISAVQTSPILSTGSAVSSWDQNMREARKRLRINDFEAALQWLQPALQDAEIVFKSTDSRTLQTLEELTYAYWRTGQRKQAERALKRIKKVKRKDGEYYLILGRASQRVERLSQAEKALKKAAELSPQNAKVYVVLANVYQKREKFALAAEMFEKAWALNPKDPGIPMQLADCYRYLRRFDDAVAVYRTATTLSPQRSDLLVQMGYVALDEGKNEEALAAFQKAVEAAPNDSEPYHHLAFFFESCKKYTEAAGLYKRALDILESSPVPDQAKIAHALGNLAGVYDLAGEKDKIKPLYERSKELVRSAPNHARALMGAGRIAGQLNLLKEANAFFERALANAAPNDFGLLGDALSGVATIASKNKQYDDAEKAYKQALNALEKVPGFRTYYRNIAALAELYVRMKKNKDAETYYNKAIALLEITPENPNYAKYMERLAQLYRQWGAPEQAAGLEKRLLQIRSKQPQ